MKKKQKTTTTTKTARTENQILFFSTIQTKDSPKIAFFKV